MVGAQGTQRYVREGDMGDPQRLFIGGVQSLYRVQTHSGSWEDDRREGPGVNANIIICDIMKVMLISLCVYDTIGEATLFNNDKILGTFKSGIPDNLVLYKWGASKEFRERYVMYKLGQRVEWKHENTQTLRKLQRLMSQQASFGFTMDSDDDSTIV